MTDLHDFITIRPEELIDSLADGPRAGQFNPSPEEVQELLAQVHAEEHPPSSQLTMTSASSLPPSGCLWSTHPAACLSDGDSTRLTGENTRNTATSLVSRSYSMSYGRRPRAPS